MRICRSKSVESAVQITLNGEHRELRAPLSIAELLSDLGLKPEHVAVEVNRTLITRSKLAKTAIANGDVLEVVTLVGGGSLDTIPIEPLSIGNHVVRSRLFVGTGKYATLEQMRDCLDASGAEVVTVAVRRERLFDREGRNLLDYLDPRKYVILPNTAGCFSAEDALRTARLGRELLEGLDNPGADWVKLEVLADSRTLLPDPVATLDATRILVGERFQVLCYTSDDPVMAARLKEAGATSVMPAGSPIGSGQGVLNPNNIRIILEDLKRGDPDYPVIVDAGVGTASDVAIAMELGCDGVLLNTGIAGAADPLRMAHAMRLAVESGWLAARAGRIPRKLYATASSPTQGTIGPTVDLEATGASR
jgi:thiazole synthase